MGKRYLDTKKDSLESSILNVWQEAAVKQEKLVGGQKKLDKDKDGDIDGKDFAMLRKAAKKDKKEEVGLDEKSQYGPDIKGEISQLQKMLKGLERGQKTPGRGFAKMKIKELIADLEKRQAQDDAIIKLRGEEVELDEGKMKDLSMKIDNIVAKMKKDRNMKGFADKFKKDAMKSMDVEKSLEKVLPDYIAGKDIQKLMMKEYYEMGTDEYRKHTQEITPGQQIQDYGRLKMQSMKEALAKVWGLDESDSSMKKEKKDLTKELKGGKTLTGKESDTVDVEPKLEKKK